MPTILLTHEEMTRRRRYGGGVSPIRQAGQVDPGNIAVFVAEGIVAGAEGAASGADVGPSPPLAPQPGAMWWDGSAFSIFDGSAWQVVTGGGALTLPLSVAQGGTGVTSVAAAPFLPLTGGTFASNAALGISNTLTIESDTLALLPPFLVFDKNTNHVDVRGNWTFGDLILSPANVAINGGLAISPPLAITSGGTGANTAAAARTNLGITQANLGGPFLPLAGGTLAAPSGTVLTVQRAGLQQGITITGGTATGYALIISDITGGGGLRIQPGTIPTAATLFRVDNSASQQLFVISGSTATGFAISVGSPTGPAVLTRGSINVQDGYYVNGVKLEFGPPDSGGTGFRQLIVPN